MCMAATRRIAPRIRCMGPKISGPMHMIPMLLDVIVNVRVDRFSFAFAVTPRLLRSDGEMLTALPLDARAVDHMPKVRNDAHLRPKLSVFVEVDPPRIAAPFGEDFENVARRMITPNARIHPLPLILRRARFTNTA